MGSGGSPGWWAGLAGLGLLVGLVAGMFGIGGGFLLIPALNVVFGIPLDIAIGTGLCQTIGTAVAAYRRHRRLRQGEVKVDWLMMAGALLGVSAGAATVEYLSTRGVVAIGVYRVAAAKLWISVAYIAVLTVVGLWMIYDARMRPGGVDLPPGPLARVPLPPYTVLPATGHQMSILVLSYLGLGLGFLSGLMGIGGGTVLMPILIYGIGMRLRMAAGTGILLLLSTSVGGTIAHARLGHVHLGLAMVLLAGSTFGAPVGATLTARVSGRRLRALFGTLMLGTAAAVVWDLARAMTR